MSIPCFFVLAIRVKINKNNYILVLIITDLILVLYQLYIATSHRIDWLIGKLNSVSTLVLLFCCVCERKWIFSKFCRRPQMQDIKGDGLLRLPNTKRKIHASMLQSHTCTFKDCPLTFHLVFHSWLTWWA